MPARTWFGGIAIFLIGVASLILGADTPLSAQAPPMMRWQITQEESARAEDRSSITLTGNGTFNTGKRDEVAGGGTWTTRNANRDVTGSGSYTVTELVSWFEAPSSPGGTPDMRAGLAVLRVRYSNGTEGTLVVSCHLAGTPDSVFEGVIASMGFVPFWNHDRGGAGTLFTLVRPTPTPSPEQTPSNP